MRGFEKNTYLIEARKYNRMLDKRRILADYKAVCWMKELMREMSENSKGIPSLYFFGGRNST